MYFHFKRKDSSTLMTVTLDIGKPFDMLYIEKHILKCNGNDFEILARSLGDIPSYQDSCRQKLKLVI